ncbi:MAG TPA: hypothetical protein VM223_29040 [Planctomycetota bacterium]|nr:hypothetical protein [Planctomycetota bacterium]
MTKRRKWTDFEVAVILTLPRSPGVGACVPDLCADFFGSAGWTGRGEMSALLARLRHERLVVFWERREQPHGRRKQYYLSDRGVDLQDELCAERGEPDYYAWVRPVRSARTRKR